MSAPGKTLDVWPDSTVAEPVEPVTARTGPTWFDRNWPLLALAVGAFAVAILARHLVYPSFSWNRDEATYLWQMDVLRGGHIFTPDGGVPQFYWPWLAGFRDGVFFPQYTVGWPLFLLAVDAIFGSPELACCVRRGARRARHICIHPRCSRTTGHSPSWRRR